MTAPARPKKVRGKKPLAALLGRVARRLEAAAEFWSDIGGGADWPEPAKRYQQQARAARREATALRAWIADLKAGNEPSG